MTLQEKLDTIAKTSTVKSLNIYPDVETAKDFDELWEKVIKPNLPSTDIVKKWHKLLMQYIQQDNAVFSLRNPYQKDKESRRGFLNKVYVCGRESFETFYIDNSVPFYFYCMAKDGFVPDPVNITEFNDVMINNRTFPYGYFSSNIDKPFVAYQTGKNPGINEKGYKLAHIFPTGENYSDKTPYHSIAEFCNTEFPRADKFDWTHYTLSNGKYYRRIDIADNKKAATIRAFAVAHFLRSVHPINYFLVPLTTKKDKNSQIKKTNIYWIDPDTGVERDEIGEYPPLIEYVAAKIKSEYENVIGNSGKSIYDEFLDLIFPVGNCIDPKGNNLQIDAEYAIGIWQKKIGSTPVSVVSKTTKTRTTHKHPEITIILSPNDPDLFKKELLVKKQAQFELTYIDGSVKKHSWTANKFTSSSDLIGNIKSRLNHRDDRDEIIKAVFKV